MESVPHIIHESWHEHLQPLFDDDRMKIIRYDLLPNSKFHPNSDQIFRVFSMPLHDIQVVIIGQDPYPTPGHANGLAFAVNEGIKQPASMRFIQKELNRSLVGPDENDRILPETLSHWVNQGVFLLNTALTVQTRKAGSHLIPWKWFTESVIDVIHNNVDPVWLAWGRKAEVFVPTENNALVYAPHPASEAYGHRGFIGSGCFIEVNKYLQQPIKWI